MVDGDTSCPFLCGLGYEGEKGINGSVGLKTLNELNELYLNDISIERVV